MFNKNKAREYVYEHSEGWNTSCNVASLQRPKTREVNRNARATGLARDKSPSQSPEREKSSSPEGRPKTESPQKLNSKAERREKYEENSVRKRVIF